MTKIKTLHPSSFSQTADDGPEDEGDRRNGYVGRDWAREEFGRFSAADKQGTADDLLGHRAEDQAQDNWRERNVNLFEEVGGKALSG